MKLGHFITLIRIPSLSATLVPVCVGGSIAFRLGIFHPYLWIDFFGVAILMQMATNVFNEHGDYVKGIDKTKSYGFAGLIVDGTSTPRQILWIGITMDLLAFFLSIPLILIRGLILLLLGGIALLIGVIYSEGPLPLSKTPFGEMIVGITMGLVEVVASEFVSSGKIVPLVYYVSVPLSLLVAMILLANNIRDLNKDKSAGRRTIPVLVGKRYSEVVFALMLVASYIWMLLISAFTESVKLLTPLLSIPVAILGFRNLRKVGWLHGVEISSMIYLTFGLLLALGIIL
ncbi:MAG: prenyltransferase [Nitrososphaerota archaeon]|jgi:1,4-dihydroxy-2-naphthoate octaprenyltransferase|nr:prenyltransferase [Nitrososphaerota archaeon]